MTRSARSLRIPPLIGWTAHYAIGIAYAVLLLAISGLDGLYASAVLAALLLHRAVA